LVRGGRFLAEGRTFLALFSGAVTVTGGCRFAMDDVVEDEKDERRLLLWLDILNRIQLFLGQRKNQEQRFELWYGFRALL
jgi:hypothetical protein